MVSSVIGELIWYRHSGGIRLGIYAPKNTRLAFGRQAAQKSVSFSSMNLKWLTANKHPSIIYRHPITLRRDGDRIVAGPVFAILAGSDDKPFFGSRANFRDLMNVARAENKFIYVIPAANVTDSFEWKGYVRIGYQRWIEVPCPLPEAVYNRIPTRYSERSQAVYTAKRRLQHLRIPVFNPDYFNKADIYEIIHNADLAQYLPHTSRLTTRHSLQEMLSTHRSVYLKPSGGSIGHGIMRIDRERGMIKLSVLKNSTCRVFTARNNNAMWKLVLQQRVKGPYVVQAAKSLIQWEGHPCDFRVLLQKWNNHWHMVGKGVRVAGSDGITTHVPNGGYIANADRVLQRNFPEKCDQVQRDLEQMAVNCARAIDNYYDGHLGEMSMDIGIDVKGHPWFFEANSKPMKFDEPDIRSKSLSGILAHLEEIRSSHQRVMEYDD